MDKVDYAPDFEVGQELESPDEIQPKGRELTDEEEREYRDGLSLEEMEQTNPGWQVVKKKLETLAYHSWVDPRTIDKPGGSSKEEWEWRELNAFHAANNAKELLDWIKETVDKTNYLGKVKSGEIATRKFNI